MKKLILMFMVLAILSTINSCSKSAKPRNFKLVLGNITATGVSIDGGGGVKLVNTITKEELILKFKTAPYVVTIPNGTWDIYVVGYLGPGLWQGANYCGGITGKVLDGNDTDITINATQTNCLNSPYPALILKLNSENSWDFGLWDQAIWSK